MKRKLLICFFISALSLSICQIGVAAAETEISTEAVTDALKNNSELSDDIYSFEVKIDGELYKFPMSYEDFTAKGWTYKDDETAELAPNTYSSTEAFTKGDLKLYASVFNLGLNTVPISQSTIGGISIDNFQFQNAPQTTIELPREIAYGTATLEDVTAAYGTPSETYEGDLYTKLTYEYDSYQDIDLYIDTETKVLNKIDIRNFTADEESRDADAAQVSDEPTEEVLAYQSPSELGDDLNSFIIDFAGNLYQLPAPVAVFLENGWTLMADDSEAIVAGKDSGWVSLMKDNQKFRTLTKNYNANAATIENCFVTSVEVNVNSTNLPLTVQKGITMGISEAELLAALGDVKYEIADNNPPYIYYNIKDEEYSTDYVQVLVNRDKDQVTGIRSQYNPKSLD